MNTASRPLFCLCFLMLFTNPVYADPAPVGGDTRSGEFIEFEVYWTNLLVGKVNVTNHGMTVRDGHACLKLEAYARTDGPIETLYEARMKYLGFLNPDFTPWLYEEWEKDSGWRLQSWLEFPADQPIVRRYKKGRLRNQISIPPGTLDPAAAVHHLLSLPLVPGGHHEVTVSQGKDLYFATADVRQGPVLDSIFGPVRTVEVTPRIFFEGKPLGNRVLKAWFTADARRVPVRLFADIEYGSFSAEVVKYRPPCADPSKVTVLSWER